jgi:hypothetical protein
MHFLVLLSVTSSRREMEVWTYKKKVKKKIAYFDVRNKITKILLIFTRKKNSFPSSKIRENQNNFFKELFFLCIFFFSDFLFLQKIIEKK